MKLMKHAIPVLLVVGAGIWAYHTNVASGKVAMDMSAHVSSAGASFPVTLASVERGKIAGSVTYTGSVAPLSEEDIYPRVTGRILEIPVYPGDAVRAGQVVARLDDVELTSRVREADAMLATSQANRTQMEADLLSAHHGIVQMEKELVMAQADAGYQQSVAARDEQLFTKGAVAKQEAENSRAMASAAQAKVEAAQAKLDQARAMHESARKKLEAANAMVAQSGATQRTAQIVHDYVTIVAPSAGYVVKRLVAPGVLVQPGMPILKTVRIDQVRLQANVGEKDLPLIRVGSPVGVTGTSNGHPPLTARVTSVFPYVDPGARTAVVEAVVDNGNRRFVPGQYVMMQFVTGDHAEALSVPLGAVVRMGGKSSVWVVRADKAEPREVTTGMENTQRLEILSGLEVGEQVVARGKEGLYAGAQVSAIPPEVTPAALVTEPAKVASAQDGAAAPGAGHTGHGVERMLAQAPTPKASEMQIALAGNPVKLSSGSAKVRIEVKDGSGAAVSDAKVEVSAGMPGMNVPKVAARPAKEPGVYEATLKLGMAGAWTLEVTATRQDGTTSAKLNLEAK
ncbi:MAG TPA: FixH family protein [Candidatus Acidoferrum sp.]|nr:FixH family protein [Candidatus Acidoferrum sp.]